MRPYTHSKARYSASDILRTVINQPQPYDIGIAILDGTPEIADLNQYVPGIVTYYSYTLVLSGNAVLSFNGLTVNLETNSLFICPPGIAFDVLDCSKEYKAICIMAEESFTCQLSDIKNVIKASYFPIIHRTGIMPLSALESEKLRLTMENIRRYYYEDENINRTECLRLLHNLLILDILNIQSGLEIANAPVSERAEGLFIEFIRLLHQHAVSHHEISFYSHSLSISSIYLSRVVKKLTGRTVMDFINQMLLIEATSLLSGTDLPVSTIAEKMNFATSASFCKFFTRKMGLSPSSYRKQFRK